MKLALSSCWNSHRHTDGFEMAKEIAGLGFEYMELSHGIRLSLVPGILKAVDDGLIRVSSVHNFCPLPPGVLGAAPNLYEPTGSSRQEQTLWFRNTIRTIDFANRVGADLMVIHSGSVRFWWKNPELDLDNYRADRTQEELDNDPDYIPLREKCLKIMRKRQKKFRERLVANFRSLLPFAQEKQVRIGIENREGFSELPLDTEMYGLLAELDEPRWFGYWHDSGHAEIKSRIGTIPHRELLHENSARQFGFHLHDVSLEEKDHQPVGSGVIDWEMIRSFVRPDHIIVLELNPKLRTRAIRQSHEFVKDLLADIAVAG